MYTQGLALQALFTQDALFGFFNPIFMSWLKESEPKSTEYLEEVPKRARFHELPEKPTVPQVNSIKT